MRTIACVFVAGVFLFAACGDDDDSSNSSNDSKSGGDYVESLSKALQDGGSPSFTLKESDCLAQAIVDAAGGESALKDADVTAKELAESNDLASLDIDVSADAKDQLADDVKDCNAAGVFKDQLVGAVFDASGASVTAASVDCVTAEIDDDAVSSIFAETAVDANADTSEIQTAVTSAMEACPDTMTEALMGGEALATAYGGELPEDDTALGCIATYVTDHAADVAAAFTGGDESALATLSTTIAGSCPATPPAAEAPAA
jgi:hypothetical protein